MTKNKTTAERLTRLETKLDLLMSNHLNHIEKRLTRLEAGMIGLMCFAITNLIVVVWNLI